MGIATVRGTVIDSAGKDATAVITGPAIGPDACGDYGIFVTCSLRGVSKIILHQTSEGLTVEPRTDPAHVLAVHDLEAQAARKEIAADQQAQAKRESRELQAYKRIVANLPPGFHREIGHYGGQHGAGKFQDPMNIGL